MVEATPEDLLSAARAGDLAALERLLRIHRQGVYRYGLRVCRTTEDAEDALQETLWLATRAITRFRGAASSLVSWMFTIIRRECFRLVERRREAPIPDDLPDDACPAPDPEAVLSAHQRSDAIARALAALDPLHREVILLRDIDGRSAPEAAARLGISVDALKSRLHRARTRLREQVLLQAGGCERAVP